MTNRERLLREGVGVERRVFAGLHHEGDRERYQALRSYFRLAPYDGDWRQGRGATR